MKKTFIIAAVSILALSSCTFVRPGFVTSASSLKSVKIEKKVWFGIAFEKDLSLAKAVKKGNITKIATVDYGVKGGLFSNTYFIVVTGE